MTDQPAPDHASDPGAAQAGGAAARTCPWCGAAADDAATQCAACGAALAQRESIGELRIPGLTSVDPALEDYDKRPLHLRGPSPSQGMAPALIVGAMAGGPIGLAAIGGVAAVAAAEYMGAGRGGAGRQSLDDVGRPSAVVLQALERADDADDVGAGETEPSGDDAAAGAREVIAGASPEARPDAAARDGRDIWRDLPRAGDPPQDEEDTDGR